MHRGEVLKVWEACGSEQETMSAPGTIVGVAENGIIVTTGSGCISLEVVQPPNRARMRGRDYANGYRLEPGEILGGPPDGA